jgi:hypothetical protein
MSGKRKPSPESSLTSLSPNSQLLSSSSSAYPFYGDEDKNAIKDNGAISFVKSNQQKANELKKSAKINQKPQKQNVLLSTRSKTFDSIPSTLELNNDALASSSSSFDYDSVHSPGGASNTSSEGPTYVRTPGFEHHAQEFEIQRKRQQYSKSRATFTSHVDEQDCNNVHIASGHDNIGSSSKGSQNGAVSNVTTKKKKSLVLDTSSSKHEAGTTKKTDSPQQSTSKHKSKKGTFHRLNSILQYSRFADILLQILGMSF